MKSIHMILLIFIIFFSAYQTLAEELNPINFEEADRAIVANEVLIVALQNRSAISFSAVQDYNSSSAKFCSFTYPSPANNSFHAMTLSVGRDGSISQNQNSFCFVSYDMNSDRTFLVGATIGFTTCQLTQEFIKYLTPWVTDYQRYSVLGINLNRRLAFYFWQEQILIQSLTSTGLNPERITIPTAYGDKFIPMSVDLRTDWGILVGYRRFTSGSSTRKRFTTTALLLSFPRCLIQVNVTCLDIRASWTMTSFLSWQIGQAPSTSLIDFEYNALYAMSVSISDTNQILLGVQSINTVFYLTTNTTSLTFKGSRYPSTSSGVGFGRSVGWIDETTSIILSNNYSLDYSIWRSSSIEIFQMNINPAFSVKLSSYNKFPNTRQQKWSQLDSQLVDSVVVQRSGSLMFMDILGIVHVIRPNLVGYYANTRDGFNANGTSIYIAPNSACSAGTYKNQTSIGKDIFLSCSLCPENTYRSNTVGQVGDRCYTCLSNSTFCPWGSVEQLPIEVLESYTQLYPYPQTPENDVLEDILLVNMFYLDYRVDCVVKQPLFWAVNIMSLGVLFLLFMGILKLTGKCKDQRRIIKKIFKQTDLIGEGELWIGGVASFAVMVICIFAYRFSGSFMHQYPIESAGPSTFACDENLTNAKFSTTMQSLATPISDELQPIFNMLDEQPFTLHVAFINTDFSDVQLNISHLFGSFKVLLDKTATTSTGILYSSVNLTSHQARIQFNVSSESMAGAVRIGLTGPSKTEANYHIQELNFSQVFYYEGRTLTQNPTITLEMVRMINETQPLANNEETQYSAVWIPIFIANYDQMFYTEELFNKYHTETSTILFVQLTEASYYISNVQEPIAKLTEVIFTDILFSTMCIELFALTFLFFKLAILPILRFIIQFLPCVKKVPKQVTPGSNVCPYCRSVNGDQLPAFETPIKRASIHQPSYTIRRHVAPDPINSNSINLPTIAGEK